MSCSWTMNERSPEHGDLADLVRMEAFADSLRKISVERHSCHVARSEEQYRMPDLRRIALPAAADLSESDVGSREVSVGRRACCLIVSAERAGICAPDQVVRQAEFRGSTID